MKIFLHVSTYTYVYAHMYIYVCVCVSDTMEEIKDIKNINSQGPYSLVEKRHRKNFYQYGCDVTQAYRGGL